MVILLLLWRAEGYHQSAVGHLSPFIHECRTYYLNSRNTSELIDTRLLREIVESNGLVLKMVGAFDDPESGFVGIGKPEMVKVLVA